MAKADLMFSKFKPTSPGVKPTPITQTIPKLKAGVTAMRVGRADEAKTQVDGSKPPPLPAKKSEAPGATTLEPAAKGEDCLDKTTPAIPAAPPVTDNVN